MNKMKGKKILLILICILLIVYGFYFFISDGTEPAPVAKDQPEPPSAVQQTTLPPMESSYHEDEAETASLEYENEIESENEAVVEHPTDIEEIKQLIYDLEIEHAEDIPLLNEVVQTGDESTEDFWLGNWVSVDDWKEDVNGFNLEPQGDGTFIFYPDEATMRTYTFFETPRTYTYDPLKKEFYWEMDYYGKTISHRARFINDNVLAMMLISGDKVTLDIYRKQSAEYE